jgi:poly-gamma-glutamate biosynthesis protein PgsC/CapC
MVNAILIGLIIAIVFYEITTVSPGGLIVPGILAMYFHRIDWILYTVGIAFLTYFLVKWLSKYVLIFGKRKFVLMIMTGILLNYILSLFISYIPFTNLSIIGYTVAGILANELDKQGIKRTIPALLIVLLLTRFVILLIAGGTF